MTRFGVGIGGGVPNGPVQYQSIRNLGCAEVRMHLRWDQVEATRGRYDWSWPDLVVREVRGAGLGFLPIVIFSPPWHRPDRRDPPDPQTYANFALDVLVHYECPAIEVWNEPNWPLPTDPAWPLDWKGNGPQYADLYATTRAAVHGRFGQRKSVVFGGLAYPNAREWLGPIWSRCGPIDALGYHPYGFGPDPAADSWQKMQQMVNFLNKRGSKAPLDITEIGLPVGLASPSYTEKDRAGFLKRLAADVQPWKRVRRFNVYTWTNHEEWNIAEQSGAWKGGASGYAKGIAS